MVPHTLTGRQIYKVSIDRRNPHKPFDRSLIRGFLRDRDIMAVELLPAGKNNTNYKLILDGGGTYVLRLYSQGNAEREASVMDLVRDLVPVPVEVYRGESWSVFSFLDGEHLEMVPEHSGAAAQAIARISSVVLEAPGMINTDGSVTAFPFGGVRGFASEKLAMPEVRFWLGQRLMDAIREILLRESQRLAELDAEHRLVHGDFNPSNILIREGVVSGILDWEYCHSGTPYMDIGNLLRHTGPGYHGLIEDGLRAGGMSLPSDWNTRARLVDLTSQLEFLTSTRSTGFKRACVARVEGFAAQFQRD